MGNAPPNEQNTVLVGMPPTEEDTFYIGWGRDTLKNNLVFANDVLRQLVTLNTALLGGSIAFFNDHLMDPCFKIVAGFFFLLSLLVSFSGVVPYRGVFDPRNPESIRQHKAAALSWKGVRLWTAAFLMALGFGTAMAGLVITSLAGTK